MADASRGSGALDELRTGIDLIEEAYEFFLAYAAQGLEGDAGSEAGATVRDFLDRADGVLGSLEAALDRAVSELALAPADRLRDFGRVVAEDARKARAVLRLVQSRPSISSELVDNLNGNIHLRALVLDLFVLSEIMEAE